MSPHDDLVEILHLALAFTVETLSKVDNEASCSTAEATATPSCRQVMRVNSINKTCRGLRWMPEMLTYCIELLLGLAGALGLRSSGTKPFCRLPSIESCLDRL
ncbi:hypothetical protein RHMOL_Rhmol01G0168700 [Rhododendron molle]|uniref:Uncharacterized protein n=1 Tax=Rhododendron molle TaxID=49168 RepID=A0ACC0Q2S9_RHOML|nr:hypothetical protein RHMOL_Rhmol01G0168700 [Rhododendron molle]